MSSSRVSAHLGQATLSNSAWYLGQLITFLAIAEDTAGHYSLLRIHASQGAAWPAHAHTQEDETISLLVGEITVYAGGEVFHVGAHETLTIPRGVEHAVRHDSAQVTYLLHFSPAGFERYFHELSTPAEFLGLPPHPVAVDGPRMLATAARYGCVFSAPLHEPPHSRV